jgi:uncharacterized OB-fold protein
MQGHRIYLEEALAGGAAPTPTPDTEPFWEAARQDRLVIQRCLACGRHYFYPRDHCPHCSSGEVEWRQVSGSGRLISYVINYRPLPPAEPDDPQVIALVELQEGPRMLTNIVGTAADPDCLPLDAPVSVCFETRGDWKLPVFRLVPGE